MQGLDSRKRITYFIHGVRLLRFRRPFEMRNDNLMDLESVLGDKTVC